MKHMYVFIIIYSFSVDYIAKAYGDYKRAVKELEKYLEEEIETVKRECEYTPTVIKNTEDDVILIYGENRTVEDLDEDHAIYKVIEI